MPDLRRNGAWLNQEHSVRTAPPVPTRTRRDPRRAYTARPDPSSPQWGPRYARRVRPAGFPFFAISTASTWMGTFVVFRHLKAATSTCRSSMESQPTALLPRRTRTFCTTIQMMVWASGSSGAIRLDRQQTCGHLRRAAPQTCLASIL